VRIIISPAKKMNIDTDSFPPRGLPRFLPQTEEILMQLQRLSYEELKSLWKCNDQITALNANRIRSMDLRSLLTPAILSYEGIQYRYMAPGVFTESELEYIQNHLRILSGFYGILRPFDGVHPYRLEMQAKLKIGESKDLYDFWGSQIAESLFAEADCILNLASKEYSLCVSRYLKSNTRFITCIFAEEKGEKLIEKGTLCKMARGEMVRYLAEHQIEDVLEVRNFDRLGYRFAPQESNDNTFVFIKADSCNAVFD